MSKILFKTTIVSCSDQINHQELNKLIYDNNIQLQTEYLQVMTKNLDNNFEGFFAIVTYDESVVAWTYFFIDDNFGFHGILGGAIGKLYKHFPIRFKTTFISSPISEYNCFHVSEKYAEKKDDIIESMLLEILNFSKKKKVKLFLIKDHIHECTSPVVRKEFVHLHFMPGTIIDLENMCGYENIIKEDKFEEIGFQNYLKSLKKKRRANIRNKMNNRKEELSVEVVPAQQLTEMENRKCYKLYLQTIGKQKIKHECLSERYFSECAIELGKDCSMLIARVDKQIVGCAQLLENQDSIINVRMGMDYEYAKEYQIYYHLLYENIKYTIRNRKKYLYTSQTCYRPKLEVGAKFVPLHTYVHFTNPILHSMLSKIIVNNCKCYTELINANKPSEILNKYGLSSY